MFTGIIEGLALLEKKVKTSAGFRFSLKAKFRLNKLKIGESIALNGCCLTLVGRRGGKISFDVARESLKVTTLGTLKVGERVNLERALRWGDRIGGHLVSGHVDARGKIIKIKKFPRGAEWSIRFPLRLRQDIPLKGSIAIDGVSLTINRVTRRKGGGVLKVFLIPHTLKVTNLKDRRVGDLVNLEVDRTLRRRQTLRR